MKGSIIEHNDGKGYQFGIPIKEQPKAFKKQKRIAVWLIDIGEEEPFFLKNQKGGNILAVWELSNTKVKGFIN